MAKAIVYFFEAIEIQEQEAQHRTFTASAASNAAFQFLQQKNAVRKPGQWIVICSMPQLLFHTLALRNVHHRTDHTCCTSTLVDNVATVEHYCIGTVSTQEAVFTAPVL